MIRIIGLIFFLSIQSLGAFEASQFEARTGLKGTYNESEKVYKVNFPRTDIKVSVNGFQLDPFMGLTSWAAFTPSKDNNFLVMGDLVLFEDEVNPVMSILLKNNVEVTALHNHFFYDQPRVFFMHMGGSGTIEGLSTGIKKAMEEVQQIRKEFPILHSQIGIDNKSEVKSNSITATKLETIFGQQGQMKDGIVKFVIGRKTKMLDTELGKEMGVNTWAAFGGTDDNAIVDGDFAMTEEELQPVLNILRKGNINIVAIHNHMIMEKPRMIFLHYWGIGRAEDMAKTLKAALRLTQP